MFITKDEFLSAFKTDQKLRAIHIVTHEKKKLEIFKSIFAARNIDQPIRATTIMDFLWIFIETTTFVLNNKIKYKNNRDDIEMFYYITK